MATVGLSYPGDYTQAHDASSSSALKGSAAVQGSFGLRLTITATGDVGLVMPKVGDFAANVTDAMIAVAMKDDGSRLTLRHPVAAGTPSDGLAAGDLSAVAYLVQIQAGTLYIMRGAYDSASPTTLVSYSLASAPNVGPNNHKQIRALVETVSGNVNLAAWYASVATPSVRNDAHWTLLGAVTDSSGSKITAGGGFGFGGRKGFSNTTFDFDYVQQVKLT